MSLRSGRKVVLVSSPAGSTRFLRSLQYVSAWAEEEETVVFLLQDATPAAKSGARHLPRQESLAGSRIRFFALDEDLSLRGISPEEARPDVSVVSYEHLLNEIEAADRVVGSL